MKKHFLTMALLLCFPLTSFAGPGSEHKDDQKCDAKETCSIKTLKAGHAEGTKKCCKGPDKPCNKCKLNKAKLEFVSHLGHQLKVASKTSAKKDLSEKERTKLSKDLDQLGDLSLRYSELMNPETKMETKEKTLRTLNKELGKIMRDSK